MPPEITPVSYSVPVIFRSARGRVVLHRLALTAADTPETILLKLQVLYKTHVKLSRRLFHRIALVQKPVVELAGFGMAPLGPVGEDFNLLHYLLAGRKDDLLTRALKDPKVLAGVSHETFTSRYGWLGSHAGPQNHHLGRQQAVLVIGLEKDEFALACLRSVSLVASIGLAIGLGFV